MTDTQEFYEAWKREHEALGRAEGLTKGRAEGLAEGAEALSKGLDVIYRIRFGAMPSELRSVVEATKDPATLLAWLQLVETSSAEAFAAAVLASRPA